LGKTWKERGCSIVSEDIGVEVFSEAARLLTYLLVVTALLADIDVVC
jgi:hypothetical protein